MTKPDDKIHVIRSGRFSTQPSQANRPRVSLEEFLKTYQPPPKTTSELLAEAKTLEKEIQEDLPRILEEIDAINEEGRELEKHSEHND